MNNQNINITANNYIATFLKEIRKYNLENQIKTLGLFGSVLTENTFSDVDILLITNNIINCEDVPEETIDNLHCRMTNPFGYTTKCPTYTNNPFVEIGKEIATKSNLSFNCGIGPSTLINSGNIYIHLNGPMSESTWLEFSKQFPYHAKSICRNFYSFIGGRLSFEKNEFSKSDSIKYKEIMTKGLRRIELEPRYIFKVVKAAALLINSNSSGTKAEIEYLYNKNIINAYEKNILYGWLSNANKYNIHKMKEVGSIILNNIHI